MWEIPLAAPRMMEFAAINTKTGHLWMEAPRF